MSVGLKLFALYLLVMLEVAHADNHSGMLSIKPDRCIGLQEGQVCFETLTFTWSLPDSGEFCLYDERQDKPLLCWTDNAQQTFTQHFESNINVVYEIRLKNSHKLLAQALVKVSWIYKSNTSSTSRWRLF